MRIVNDIIIANTHLINTKHEDIGISSDLIRTKIAIEIKDITAWRVSYSDETNLPDGIIVYTLSDNFYIEDQFDDFTEMLMNYKNENKNTKSIN